MDTGHYQPTASLQQGPRVHHPYVTYLVIVVLGLLLAVGLPSAVLASSTPTPAMHEVPRLALAHQLLYIASEGPLENLYLRQPSPASRSLRLTNLAFPYDVLHPGFSPDGQYVLYRRVSSSPDDKRYFELIGVTGTPRFAWFDVHGIGYSVPTWNHDSRAVAFRTLHTAYGTDEVYTIDIESRDPLTIATNATSGPVWDLSGSRLYYAAMNTSGTTDDLHVVNADGTGNQVVAEIRGKTFLYGVVADGRILFRKYDAAEGSDELYLIRPDGTELTRLTMIPGYESRVSIAPNRHYIFFGRGSLIHLIDLDGTVVWTFDCGDNCGLIPSGTSWSPDSQTVAFTIEQQSGSTFVYNLYTADVSPNATPILILEEDAKRHGFSADGRYFAYDDTGPVYDVIRVVDLTTNMTTTMSTPNAYLRFAAWRPIP